MNEGVVAKVAEVAERVGRSEGLEVLEVTFAGGGKHRVLRITIDKPQGVTHGDCEIMSQQVGTILDVEDVIPGGTYHLEVSSPGVERKLVKLGDYQRFLGRKARVVLRQPAEGRKDWEGILAEVTGDAVTLEAAPGQQVRFTLDQVSRANLKLDW